MPSDYLKDVKYAVFGLGDSGYLYFNEAAKRIDERMAQLGAKRIIPIGMGDDTLERHVSFDTLGNCILSR